MSDMADYWKIKGKYEVGDRVTIRGDEDEGIDPKTGTVVRLFQRGDEPIQYWVKADDTGKEWCCWDYDLTTASASEERSA